MPRNFSLRSIESYNASESTDVPLIFVTISHDQLVDDVYLVNDGFDYVRDGKTWGKCAFKSAFLNDDDERPQTGVSINNVDQQIGRTLKAIDTALTMKIELLSSYDFDLSEDPRTEIGTAEVDYCANHLFLREVNINNLEITGTLSGKNYAREQTPFKRATPDLTPGIFY